LYSAVYGSDAAHDALAPPMRNDGVMRVTGQVAAQSPRCGMMLTHMNSVNTASTADIMR